MRISKYFQMLQGKFSHSQSQPCIMYSISIFLLSIYIYFTFTIVYSLCCTGFLLREQFTSKHSLGVQLKQLFSYSKSWQMDSYHFLIAVLTRLVKTCRSTLTAVSNRPVCHSRPQTTVFTVQHGFSFPLHSLSEGFESYTLLSLRYEFPVFMTSYVKCLADLRCLAW